ncbi:hypothetical protein [Arcanobacterium canis]
MSNMNTMDWLEKVTATHRSKLSINSIATGSKIPQATLNRRIKAGTLDAEMVIAISRAYNYDVIEAFLELGILTERDLCSKEIKATIRDATDKELADEIMRRMRRGGGEVFDRSINTPDDGEEGA